MRILTCVAAFAMLVLTGCETTEAKEASAQEIKNLTVTMNALAAKNDNLMAENDVLRTRAEALEAELRKLREELAAYKKAAAGVDDLAKRLKEYEEKLKGMDGVDVEGFRGGIKVKISDELLFDSGKDTLREEGKRTLRTIAEKLLAGPERIAVEGHTDNVPVKLTRAKYPLGNIELSGRRALLVLDFLRTDGGVDASRLSFGGYGEWPPTSTNDSADGRAKNRRVEILIFKDEGKDSKK